MEVIVERTGFSSEVPPFTHWHSGFKYVFTFHGCISDSLDIRHVALVSSDVWAAVGWTEAVWPKPQCLWFSDSGPHSLHQWRGGVFVANTWRAPHVYQSGGSSVVQLGEAEH